MTIRRFITLGLASIFVGILAVGILVLYISSSLPQMITVEDYKPLLVTNVYAKGGEKIGEFFRERRIIAPREEIPDLLIKSFMAAEDATFYEHQGINFLAIFRAFIANLRAGRTVQGGSTITQQVAKSLLLSPERTYIRKIREVLLAYQMEAHLTKDQIIYLYLNQIYLGQGAYGVAAATETYFRKKLKDLTLPEMAILAGLPQAPSRYTPVHNPSRAKERQRYVLSRMAEENFITADEAKVAMDTPVVVYTREDFRDKAPYFLETIRQHLVQVLGEKALLDEGLRIYSSLDYKKQMAAQDALREGLRSLDKRQGYRGPLKNLSDTTEIAQLLVETRDNLFDDYLPMKTIRPDGVAIPEREPLNLTPKPNGPNLPEYAPPGTYTKGVVTKIDDEWGLVTVRFAEAQGLIDLETMKWARKPNPNVMSRYDEITKPSVALKVGDEIELKVLAEKFKSERIGKMIQESRKKNKKYQPEGLPDFKAFAGVQLEQAPLVEAALLSFDLDTQDILAMVGGYDFQTSEFNRSIQAVRQTGSAFKPIVYTAALDKGFTPASVIIDAPLVFQEEGQVEENQDLSGERTDIKKWKPSNYSEKFTGEILFRNALIKSLNVPTVKILEKIGVSTAASYAKRLGIFSPLNMDLSLGLGSSSVTLYEITKVYANIARLGKRIRPVFIRKVEDQAGQALLENVSLDDRFKESMEPIETEFEEQRLNFLSLQQPSVQDPNAAPAEQTPPAAVKQYPFYSNDPEQLISPQTAFLMTSILKGVVEEGTGRRARALDRISAGKTGTTNGYYDAWYMGFTPQIMTGVWVGSDKERTLGRGETGASAALPIWIDYMKAAHADVPEKNFPVPPDIVFVSIDNENGHLASVSSKAVVKQPFLEGTEPKSNVEETKSTEENFYKEDLSE